MDMHAVDQQLLLAHHGTLLNASATGLLIRITPQELNPELLENDRSLRFLRGEYVTMKIVEMELEIDGTIVRMRREQQDGYELAIDFTDNAPVYWRECLAELLPGLGEHDQIDSV